MGQIIETLCVLSIWVALGITSAQAVDPTDPTAIAAGFDPTLPPQFDMAKIAGQGTSFQSCNSQVQNAANQALQSLSNLAQGQGGVATAPNASMGYGINAVCTGSDEGPSVDGLTCENIAPGGILDQNMIKSKGLAIDMALATIQCKKGKFDAIKSELSCMSGQADMLAQQLSSVQSAYQSNIQRMQKDVATLDGVIADRESEDQEVLKRLGGNGGEGGNGAEGLLKVRDDLKTAMSSMDSEKGIPGAVQKIKNDMKAVDVAKQALKEFVDNRTMGLASECFQKDSQTGFQCKPNGPNVSGPEYLLCRYEQFQKTSNGKLDPNTVLGNTAAGKTGALGGLLGKIFAQTPQKQAPTQQGQTPQVDMSAPAATIMTPDDIEKAYGTELAKFDLPGFQVHEFVKKQTTYCYQKAQHTVSIEKNMASGPIKTQMNAMDTQSDNLQKSANTMLSSYAGQYERAMTVLTGMHLPMTTSGCEDKTPNVQIACLEDLKRNLNGVLYGRVKQAQVTQLIKGVDAQGRTDISFQCSGIDGCIAKYQQVDVNLKKEKIRVAAFKKTYIQQSVQSTDNFTKRMASMMNAQSQALTNKLKSLNTALASLGAGGISIPKVEGEPMQYDENGLPKAPNSALQLIGAQMTPKMLDVHGSDFSESLKGLGQGVTDLNAKVRPLQESKDRLAQQKAHCAGQAIQAKLRIAQQDIDKLESGNCQWSTAFCNKISSIEKLKDYMGDMSTFGMTDDDRGNMDSSLDAGIGGCGETAERRKVIQKTRGGLKDDDVQLTNYNAGLKNSGEIGSSTCNGISTRLNRDIKNIGAAQRNAGFAGSASGD
ncbi:hypothetical protein WDW37_08865 [Bdellovibrionota bacterium FG-1]